MADRLFVAVLGKPRAGKSTTWNRLFGYPVRTRKKPRDLEISKSLWVETFLISGSNEERKQYASSVLRNVKCRIVLCSVQYIEEGATTFEYAFNKGFDVYVHWLNPGYGTNVRYFDHLGFANRLLDAGTTIAMRNANGSPNGRVREIREFIYGWAASRELIFSTRD